MRPISQNKHAISTQPLAIALKQRTLSLLANWLRSSCYYTMFSLAKKKTTSTEIQIKIRPLNMPLNVWTFLIESINDAIKIIYT